MIFYFRPHIADFGYITTHSTQYCDAAQAQSTTQNKSGPAAAEPRPQPRPQLHWSVSYRHWSIYRGFHHVPFTLNTAVQNTDTQQRSG